MGKLVFALALLAAMALVFAGGDHNGEAGCISYKIVYTDMTAPFQDYSSTTPQFPGFDYAHVPAYWLGTPMKYRVEFTNTCKRTFKNLRVVGAQYYYGEDAEDLMPGQFFTEATPWYNGPTQTFFVGTLKGGQTAVLQGSYVVTNLAAPGLDRTRLLVMHWEGGNPDEVEDWSDGRVIIDDQHANIWCPPA